MASTPSNVHIRRIYDQVEISGARVLIDRLWPRGISKDDADLALWAKCVAPSHELRRWYDHDTKRHDEFSERYRAELDDEDQAAALDEIVALVRQSDVVLLTATKDLNHSHAPIVAAAIRDRLRA